MSIVYVQGSLPSEADDTCYPPQQDGIAAPKLQSLQSSQDANSNVAQSACIHTIATAGYADGIQNEHVTNSNAWFTAVIKRALGQRERSHVHHASNTNTRECTLHTACCIRATEGPQRAGP